MNHYLVKDWEQASTIHKRYDKLEEAVKHCIIYTKANEGKPVAYWVLSTAQQLLDGHVLEDAD